MGNLANERRTDSFGDFRHYRTCVSSSIRRYEGNRVVTRRTSGHLEKTSQGTTTATQSRLKTARRYHAPEVQCSRGWMAVLSGTALVTLTKKSSGGLKVIHSPHLLSHITLDVNIMTIWSSHLYSGGFTPVPRVVE